MKCIKNKCILSQKNCILRQEIVDLLNFENKTLKTFSKCENCCQGIYIRKNFPIEGKDNDVYNLMVKYRKIKKPKIEKKGDTKLKEISVKLFKKKLIKINLEQEKEETKWKRKN